MTGLIDSDVKPVHSVSKEEGLNLLEPASKAEFLRKNKYFRKTDLIVRFLALLFLKHEERLAKFRRSIFDWVRNYWKECLLIFLLVIFFIFLNRNIMWEKMVDFASEAHAWWQSQSSGQKWLYSTLSASGAWVLTAPIHGLKSLPIWPDGAKTRDQGYDSNCRDILISDSNPKLMNRWLYYDAWPSLLTEETRNDTREQSHAGATFERSEELGVEGSPWRDMRQKSLDFLLKWMKGDLGARIPIVLWCFNPPKEDKNWGDNRDRLIKQAETQFASEIYSLLDELSNSAGAVYDEFVQQAEENEKSFEWLKQQIFSTARHEPPCVQLLNLWSQHHYSKD